MNVTVSFVGVLASFVGAETASVDLPEGSRYEDLLAELGRMFAPNMPQLLWDEERRTFKAPILATRDERSLAPIDGSELVDGDQIKLFLMAAGG
jgi:hypothetical protein